MLELARAMVGVSRDILRLVVSFLRSSGAIRAENLVFRKQLASYIERFIKPRRRDHTTRVSVALFTRLLDWRNTVLNVQPATIVRWHRLGWRIFGRWKCRAVRPSIPPELRLWSSSTARVGLAHVNVTATPSADWTLQQLGAVVGEEARIIILSMTETRSSPSILMTRSGHVGT
jgi:hypothetical protein